MSSKKICAQCRHRKVRCGGVENNQTEAASCSNCRRLRFTCSFAEIVPSGDLDALSTPSTRGTGRRSARARLTSANLSTYEVPEKRRGSRACQSCHSHKVRCSGDIPKCLRCRQRGLLCDYALEARPPSGSTPRSTTSVRSAAHNDRDASIPMHLGVTDEQQEIPPALRLEGAPSDGSVSLSLSRTLQRNLIDTFFDLIQSSSSFGFFHRATFLRRWTANSLPSALINAVCGAAFRFISEDPRDHEKGALLIAEAEMAFFKSYGEASIFNVQVLIIIIWYKVGMRKYQEAMILTATVTRLAYVLRLNYENKIISFTAQESRRRLMWSIFTLNTFLAGGLDDFNICPADTIHLSLPCDERSFELDLTVNTPYLCSPPSEASTSNLGMMAYVIRMAHLRERILKFAYGIVSKGEDYTSWYGKFQDLENELHEFRAVLPERFQYSSRNLILRAYSPTLVRFISLHILWHQSYCNLYRIAIPGRRESLPDITLHQMPIDFVYYCRGKCLENAISIAKTFNEILSLENKRIIPECLIGVSAYHCFGIFLITKTLEPTKAVLQHDETLKYLKSCAAILENLASFFPGVLPMHDEVCGLLQEFQQEQPVSLWNRERRATPSPKHNSYVISKHSLIAASSNIDTDHQLEISVDKENITSSFGLQDSRTTESSGSRAETLRTSDHHLSADDRVHNISTGSSSIQYQEDEIDHLGSWNQDIMGNSGPHAFLDPFLSEYGDFSTMIHSLDERNDEEL